MYIADDATAFVAAAEKILSKTNTQKANWLKKVDAFLQDNSWDNTWQKMHSHLHELLLAKSVTGTSEKIRSVA